VLDLLIRGGRVIDGAGNPWFSADVGIAGGRIAAVGRLASEPAARVIDADGLLVCPGFVDMHTHSDLQLLVNPAHEAKLHQGVHARGAGSRRSQLRAGDGSGARPERKMTSLPCQRLGFADRGLRG